MLLCLPACAPDAGRDANAGQPDAPQCAEPRNTAPLPAQLQEASGVAVSIRHPGILWAHNDSGEPILFALDTLGNLRARIRVPIRNSDWEDLEVAPCAEGSCIYLGAIGDNLQRRTDRAVYRFAEPALEASTTSQPVRFRYRLPGEAQDMEALFVMPGERIYLITKGRSGPVTLFRFPDAPARDSVSQLEAVQELTEGLVQLPDMVTGAGATPGGNIIVVRSYSALQLYSFASDRLAPVLPGPGFDLQSLHEFQGEGVDIGENGSVYLVSEKGLGDEQPQLSKVSCTYSGD
jgi:hypothetical protein